MTAASDSDTEVSDLREHLLAWREGSTGSDSGLTEQASFSERGGFCGMIHSITPLLQSTYGPVPTFPSNFVFLVYF